MIEFRTLWTRLNTLFTDKSFPRDCRKFRRVPSWRVQTEGTGARNGRISNVWSIDPKRGTVGRRSLAWSPRVWREDFSKPINCRVILDGGPVVRGFEGMPQRVCASSSIKIKDLKHRKSVLLLRTNNTLQPRENIILNFFVRRYLFVFNFCLLFI